MRLPEPPERIGDGPDERVGWALELIAEKAPTEDEVREWIGDERRECLIDLESLARANNDLASDVERLREENEHLKADKQVLFAKAKYWHDKAIQEADDEH